MRVNNQSGFTIFEMLLSTSIAAVLATVLLTISLTYYGDVMRSHSTAGLSIESHYALHAILEDIRLADSVALTNSITDANAPAGWTTSDTNNVLVLTTPATDVNHQIIYDTNTGYPYRNERVYSISNGKLSRRSLKNTAALNNALKTTCPPATSSGSCPDDTVYTTFANDLTLTFYDDVNAATTDPTMARSVKIGLTMSRKIFGKTVTFSNTLQSTLRNK